MGLLLAKKVPSAKPLPSHFYSCYELFVLLFKTDLVVGCLDFDTHLHWLYWNFQNLWDLWCAIKGFFQLSEDWSLSVFEASVTRVSQSIGTIRVFWGSAEASQFWQKEESFFLFFFCCFCALLQTNSCEKRPLWTSIKRSRKLIFGLPKKCVFHVQN